MAHAQSGGKLHAPAAERNAEALSSLLRTVAPASGQALELASGTGQHITRFAADMPGLIWHPTDVDAARLKSIEAYVAEAGLANVARAQFLDATQPGWAETSVQAELIVLINLLHLIDTTGAKTVINETARALALGGRFVLYGPFRRNGALTSEGDARFDAQLRAADPSIGYKDTSDIALWLRNAGLGAVEMRQMPANNLAFVAERTF